MNTENSGNDYRENFEENSESWILLGKIRDVTSAEYARETLKSYEIPAVLISESGFFGQAGLNLPSLYGKNKGLFQIFVLKDDTDEAVEILNMILGDNWEKADE